VGRRRGRMTCRVGGSRFSGQGTHWASNQPLTILPRRCHRVRTAYTHHHYEQFFMCHRIPTGAPSMHTTAFVLQAPLHIKPLVFIPSSFPFQNHEHVFSWLVLFTYMQGQEAIPLKPHICQTTGDLALCSPVVST